MPLPINNLLHRVSDAVRNLPGAVELYLFGSASDPAARDAYSDLDLQVVSTDYSLSRAAWPWILQQAGRIELAYPLLDQPRELAFCITFEGESPYHKVDIGISDQQYNGGLLHKLEKKVLLWQQVAKTEPVSVLSDTAYMPEIGTAEYFLIGELLSSIRYIKARKRGQHLTCWRFLSAKFRALLCCYLWDGDFRHFPETSLSTWDFTALDRRVVERERLDLLKYFNYQSPGEMNFALLEMTRKIAARIFPDNAVEEPRAGLLIHEYLNFLEDELI